MRKILLTAAAFGLATTMGAAPAVADDHASAPELAKKDWYEIVYIKFHAGKTREAMKMIEAFQNVDKALGREGPIGFHMNTGDWDMMIAFKMEDGIAQMGWASNPRNEEWDAELARQLGGEDKAREHWAKYLSLVADSRSEVAHIDL
jgi:hypothetical protein